MAGMAPPVSSLLSGNVMKPIIVSFFTPEYALLAKRMIESVRSFGFDVDIQVIDKINGRWIDTIYWRANFIQIMLAKHQRDVVWLDCDAVMERYPVLFDDFPCDFGAHIHNFPHRKGELLGGTMYFANNEKAKELVARWINFNDSMPRQRLSQWVLEEAVKGWDGTFFNFPPEYCQIFDLMKGTGLPVISHWQASRKFRND